ncbi:MAG: glutathione S-transferase N-terminal domain-containing protein [Alphaproteobacteria bacterium]|nr:glutathione S-transferase N-terminal domain-containing protein [Alphaproteobacteria bacterium]
MKLLYSPLSPFVRKVMIVAKELGLDGRIETVPAATNPSVPNPEIAKHNPLMKIPALVTDEGIDLVESKVIVQYLDSLGGNKLIPAAGKARWKALRMEAIADGLADAGILVRYELAMRPAALQWKEWISGQLAKVGNALDQLEREASDLEGPLNVGHVAVVCACNWLEFRNVLPDARKTRPKLFAWVDRMNKERPSFGSTMPK